MAAFGEIDFKGLPLAAWCLLGFALWTLLIVIVGLGFVRVGAIVTGKAAPDAFPADVPHGSDRYRRVMRAHANCVENLPVFASVVLVGVWVPNLNPLFHTLAAVFLGARVCQTLVHIASGSSAAVSVRFAFFSIQLASVLTMVGLIVQAAT